MIEMSGDLASLAPPYEVCFSLTPRDFRGLLLIISVHDKDEMIQTVDDDIHGG